MRLGRLTLRQNRAGTRYWRQCLLLYLLFRVYDNLLFFNNCCERNITSDLSERAKVIQRILSRFSGSLNYTKLTSILKLKCTSLGLRGHHWIPICVLEV